MNLSPRKLLAAGIATVLSSGPALAQGAPSIAGKTYRFWDPGHGAQVEYMAPTGRAYLWYPGNRVVVASLWRAGTVRGVPAICFLYGTNTYNPITGSTGGRWECRPEGLWARRIVEVASGDLFALSRRSTPPFALPREPLPFSALRRGTAQAP